MKKIFLLTILVFTMFSCSTPEDKVKNEFKNYVQENFNDPDDLLEIVSISRKDTVSYPQIKKWADTHFKELNALEAKANDKLDEIHYSCENAIKNATSEDQYKIMSLVSELKEYSSFNSFTSDKLKLNNALKEAELDNSITKIDYINFEVKARILTNGRKELKTYYYAYHKDGKIKLYERHFSFEDYPEAMNKVLLCYGFFKMEYKDKIKYYNNIDELYKLIKKYK